MDRGDTVDINHLLVRALVETYGGKDAAQEVANNIIVALKPWMHLVADWIGVVRKIYLERSAFPGEQSVLLGGGLVPWYFDGERGHPLRQQGLSGSPVFLVRKGMTLSEWQLVLRLAEAQQPPPTEYIFLRDARGSLRTGSTRRAVLDAATAAEISLTKLLDARIALGGESARNALKATNRGLMRAVNALYDSYHVPLRKEDIEDGLADPRNRAIHAGVRPSRNAAKRAFDIAAELVELATPYSDVVRLDP